MPVRKPTVTAKTGMVKMLHFSFRMSPTVDCIFLQLPQRWSEVSQSLSAVAKFWLDMSRSLGAIFYLPSDLCTALKHSVISTYMNGELDIAVSINIFHLHKCWVVRFEEYCIFTTSSTARHFNWIIIPYTESYIQRLCSTIWEEKRPKQNQ